MKKSGSLIHLALLLSMMCLVGAQNASEDIPPALAKGTKVVAGPADTDEFYVIAENDEPQLRAIIAAKEDLAKQTAELAAVQKKPKFIPVHPQVVAHKKSFANLKLANKSQLVKANRKTQVNKTPTHVAKLDIKKARIQHKPSAMEIALNNALEKAIKKKQLNAKVIAKNTSGHTNLAAKKVNVVTPHKIALKKLAIKIAKTKSMSKPRSVSRERVGSSILKRTKLAAN